MVNKVRSFVSEVRTEMQKVTWSTREELIGSTLVVLATMAILSTFVGVCDYIMSMLMTSILR